MARARFVPNQAGLAALASGPEIVAATRAVAEEGAAYGQSISPSSTEEQRTYFAERYGTTSTQRYAESFAVLDVTVEVRGRPRAAARLVNTAPHSPAVEFGNAATPRPHRVVGRIANHLAGET